MNTLMQLKGIISDTLQTAANFVEGNVEIHPSFDRVSTRAVSGLFSVHFMTEIPLYSQRQIINFFPNFPIPKIRKYVAEPRFLDGLKQEKMLY